MQRRVYTLINPIGVVSIRLFLFPLCLFLVFLHELETMAFLLEILTETHVFARENKSKRVFDVNCDVTSTFFQTSVSKFFEMEAP